MDFNNKYTIERKKQYLRIILPDAIGMEDSDELLAGISGHLKEQDDMLVVDLVNTSMVYSSGFGLLIRFRKLIMEKKGSISLVNVTTKIHKLFKEFNLEKVFKLYATDVEFELDYDEIWKKNYTHSDMPFIFIAQKENDIYRITISGNLGTLNDLSKMISFEPDLDVNNYIINFENLETIDTYGAQACNDLAGRISKREGICSFYGVNSMTVLLFELFSNLKSVKIFDSEEKALASLNG